MPASTSRPTVAMVLRSLLGKRGEMSRARLGAPVRRIFVVDDEAVVDGSLARTPLMQVVRQRSGRGGPGGEVRLKLLLSLILICASDPYESTRESWVWAEFIGLEDPKKSGARRIRNAFHELEQRKFLKVEKRNAGKPSTIVLLKEDGSGDEYKNPVEAAHLEGKQYFPDDVYFRVPMALWKRQNITSLSTPALVMWLILLAETRGERRPWWFEDKRARSKYGVTASFRSKGLTELVNKKIATVESVANDYSVLHKTPPRKAYTLIYAPRKKTPSRAEERADEIFNEISPEEREALKKLILNQSFRSEKMD